MESSIPEWIPDREHHQLTTRALLTLQSLSLLPPTATFAHRDNACVYMQMCHGQQPLTRNSASNRKKLHRRERRDPEKRKKKKKSDEGHKNMLVSNSYATNVMK